MRFPVNLTQQQQLGHANLSVTRVRRRPTCRTKDRGRPGESRPLAPADQRDAAVSRARWPSRQGTRRSASRGTWQRQPSRPSP